jgi:uncharacterized protein
MNRKTQILSDLRTLLEERFPGSIERIILFGSQAMPGIQADSDFDILIIIAMGHDWVVENEIFDLCYDIDLKYDIVTDIKILSSNEMNTAKGQQPFVLEAIDKGIAA